MKATKRVKIVTGFSCNANCIFCYYRNRLHEPNRPASSILKDLRFAKQKGIEEIDFSGGEPTIHPELPLLIAAAKKMGFRKAAIITNGLRLKSLAVYRTLLDAGLDETLFSLQGGSEATHDYFTQTKGSFTAIFDAMSNAHKLGIRIRTNTVVNKLNYLELDAIVSLIAPFDPSQVNFITINDWRFAKKSGPQLMCRYSEMAPYLEKACDALMGRGIQNVNVRYIPFCAMSGYEKYVCDHGQVKYDPYEWLPHVRVRLETNISLPLYGAMLAYGLVFGKTLFSLPKLEKGDIFDRIIVDAIRALNYRKHPHCRTCRYDDLCDGVEKSYAKIFGLGELKSVPGEKIIEPFYFRKHLNSFQKGMS